jgi:hypothetical protein
MKTIIKFPFSLNNLAPNLTGLAKTTQLLTEVQNKISLMTVLNEKMKFLPANPWITDLYFFPSENRKVRIVNKGIPLVPHGK